MEPIVLTLKDKRLFSKSSNVIALVGDNADYKIHFEGISKTAVFAVFNRNGKTDKKALDENHDVLIPVWLLKKGTFEVGLYSDGFASTGISIIVRASVVEDEGAETGDVPKSVAEQLIELVNKDIASVKETKTEATAAKDAAVAANKEAKAALESITDEDNGYLTKIKGYADSAKSDSDSAAKNAEKIQGAVTAAENALSEAKDLKQVSVDILGEGGTFEKPKDNTALKQIRDIKEETSAAKADAIAAKTAAETAQTATAENMASAEAARNAAQAAQAVVAADKATVKADREAVEAAKESIDSTKTDIDAVKQEVFGTGNAQSPADGSALKEIREAKAAVDGFNDTDGSLAQAKAAAQTATNAKNVIVGESGTAQSPADGSALKKAQAAQAAAAQSAEEAKAYAESANHGISVDSEMSDTSTNPVQNKIVKKYIDDHKVEKVAGKGLSTNDYTTAEKNKLSGIADGANNYTHPDTHPASMIEQDETHRFVTDAEKTAWNNKVDKISGKGLSTNDYTTAEKNSLADILTRLSGLKFVVSNAAPTNADNSTITIVVQN